MTGAGSSPGASPASDAPRADGRPSRARVATWAALAGLVLLAHLAYRPLLGLEHFGWDTYPLIATVSEDGLVARAFGEELMSGRYPLGSFYRPVTTLAMALDAARGGHDPAAYHHTNHAILLAGVVAAFLIARRVAGGALGPLAAALVFALHPIHLATLPIAARRADMLSATLTMLLVAALPLPGRPLGALRVGLTFALAYAAAAAKETGIVALPLVLFVLLAEAEGPVRERLVSVARRGAAPVLGVVLFVVSRTIVLGGLGGHEGTGVVEALRATPGVLQNLANVTFSPVQPLREARWLAALAAYALVALWTLRRRENRPGWVLIGWLVALSGVTALGGELRTWYACPYLPWYACLVGVLVAGLARAVRGVKPVAFVVALPLAGLLVVWPLRHATLLEAYPEWAELSTAERAFLDAAAEGLERAAPGAVVEGGRLPRAVRSRLAGMRAVGLEDYSVQAWADLRFPDRRVRVASGEATAAPDEIVLRVSR